MKLVIFSPLAKTSAIGRVTSLIVQALSALSHEVIVVRTEQSTLVESPHHSCPAELIHWTNTPSVTQAVQTADVLVYQIGNNYDFHCGGLHWLAIKPGLVCLHDFVVAHLFAGWAETRVDEAKQVLRAWYGDEAPKTFFSARNAGIFLDNASRIHPMTEWVCAMATGVISHSRWGMERVMQACAGPVRVVPLPYDAPALNAREVNESHPDGMVTVLTVGHANSNKRIESVIRAIGSSPLLKTKVRYHLCGRIEAAYAVKLAALARASAVQLLVSGEAGDSELQTALAEASIACCLRWPSLEAASATAIEGMLYGKAVIVTDTGFYRDLPNDVVRKISPTSSEIVELKEVLEDLLARPEEREAMSIRGKQWAIKTFCPKNYAEELVSLAAPLAAADVILSMTDALLNQLQAWGASPALLNAKDIATPLQLFDTSVVGTSRHKTLPDAGMAARP
jgi:glycosyltransferase involved in cell wall biosynthesis